ncbi:MAG: (d)CMP kinase [Dehalococcoidia bacterium]|nr:(d)CMP kinase [Dehalococcoidia bacterium]
MTHRGPIALDGPVASGKTTVGRGVAQTLGWAFIDTGLLYRAVGLLALRANLEDWNNDAVARLAQQSEMAIDDTRVTVDGEDVSDVIGSIDAGSAASRVAVLSDVRRVLVPMQRNMAEQADGRVVMVGRDIGTVVLWDAPVKIYLDASAEARARRRYIEAVERGEDSNYDRVLSELRERDKRDAERADSPLKPAEDAHVLLTDSLTPQQVIEKVLRLAEPPS